MGKTSCFYVDMNLSETKSINVNSNNTLGACCRDYCSITKK